MTEFPQWWQFVVGQSLAQGDLLHGCLVPLFNPDLSPDLPVSDVIVKEYDCIVVTQSCDLENNKAPLVALCPTHSLMQFEEINPRYKQKGQWEQVRQGRVGGLSMC